MSQCYIRVPPLARHSPLVTNHCHSIANPADQINRQLSRTLRPAFLAGPATSRTTIRAISNRHFFAGVARNFRPLADFVAQPLSAVLLG
jgi:hypothetical protein